MHYKIWLCEANKGEKILDLTTLHVWKVDFRVHSRQAVQNEMSTALEHFRMLLKLNISLDQTTVNWQIC